MVQFFLRNSQPKHYPKNGLFWLFLINQKYAETILIIDQKIMSQEASYTAQQNSRGVESPKTCIGENSFACYSRNATFTI